MSDEINDLRRYADSCETEANALATRYGCGIRPAWVGEEICMARHRAESAREEADRLELQSSIPPQT